MGSRIDWYDGRKLLAVSLDPATGAWLFDFGDGHALSVTSPWRVRIEGAIRRTGADHGQSFGHGEPVDAAAEALELLWGQPVLQVVVADGSADLSLEFEGTGRLEVFNHSAGFEGWDLGAPGERRLVACGGGRLAQWGT